MTKAEEVGILLGTALRMDLVYLFDARLGESMATEILNFARCLGAFFN